MLKYLVNSKYTATLLVAHVILGLLATLSPFPLIIWFYVVLLSGMYLLHTTAEPFKDKVIVVLITYLSALEILCRMSRTTPWIPYEISKYLMLTLLLIGVFRRRIKLSRGWLMLWLLLPAVLYDLSGKATGYMPIVFNVLGPINMALAIIYFSQLVFTQDEFKSIFRILMYPLLSAIVFTVIKTPKFDEITFSLSANHTTSGGFGSNQVSTTFGLALLLLFVSRMEGWRLSSSKILDLILMFAFAFQGVLTFSRGGMFGGVLGAAVFVLLAFRFGNFANKRKLLNMFFFSLLTLVFFYLGFNYVDKLTDGSLKYRYQGQTEGTLLGTKEQTLNNALSNRPDIFIGDIDLWQAHPILGVGVGASRYMRDKVNGVIAHVELSRLMAEHGLLGIAYFLLLLGHGVVLVRRATHSPDAIYFFSVALFILAVFTSFHAATRTFITPLLIGLSSIGLTAKGMHSEAKVIHR